MISVVSQAGNEVVVSSFMTLAIGARIKFSDNVYGIVNQIYNATSYGVRLNSSDPVQTGEVMQWWRIAQPPFKIHVPQSFFVGEERAHVLVQCITSRKGNISWKLYHNSTLILSGNDALNPNYCKADVKGFFPEGVYRLKVTQCLGRTPIKQVEKCWTVTYPTSSIEFGMGNSLSAVNLA